METWEKEAAEKYKIEGLIVITTYDVYNMLVSALEGGSNYWYHIGDKTYDRIMAATEDMKGEPFVDRLLMAVQKGAKGINVLDDETGEKLGTLTPQSWAKAEKLMIEKHRRHLADVIGENDDATTGDVFFQLAVMGEVTFG